MASSENRDSRSSTFDTARQEAEYKKDKARAKSNFSRSKNKLMALLEETEQPSRREVLDARRKMDSCSEIATDILISFAEFYIRMDEIQKSMRVSNELEILAEEHSSAREEVKDYLSSREDERSSVTSDILTIDMLKNMDISATNKKRVETQPDLQQTEQEVNAERSSKNNPASSLPVSGHVPTNQTCRQNGNGLMHSAKFEDFRYGHDQSNMDTSNTCLSELDAGATPFESTLTCNREPPSIGQDLWRQLKRVQIPVFHGDKRTYQSWKAAFLACIDNAPATPEYKLLQLRQYVSGEALQTIESLGHSATAYAAAKERLERKYGGKRRQIAVYLEDLDNFKQVRSGNAKDLEKFADLLDIALINLKEAGQDHELGDGSLYTKLQRKLSESMLARYHRWVFENSITESVAALRQWVIQEAEFQTIAAETMHGLTGKTDSQQPVQSFQRSRNQRTFFGESKNNRETEKMVCKSCRGQHAIWKCRKFAKKPLAERWDIARRSQLCYRCLGDGHYGKLCPTSRKCGKDGCQESHHRLLHQRDRRDEPSTKNTRDRTEPKRIDSDQTELSSGGGTISEDETTSVTEGKPQQQPQQTTMVTQNYSKVDYIALRTVPIILKNGGRSLQVNALLDEASTKSYVNSDVAAELGLEGKTEKVSVNVLNGQIETFETKPVNFELQSVDGKVSLNVNAYTANRVTGDLSVIDWNEYRKKWPHLRSIEFPLNAKKPIVDVLLGLVCLDLHCAIEEVRGQPGEPVARLTPLGWTCIGNPFPAAIPTLQTHFAWTYFVRGQSEIGELNSTLKRFWEIEETPPLNATPIVQIEEKHAMKTVENSMRYDNDQNMYRLSIPWKENMPRLPENYNMALQRLQNTEKRLRKSPSIGQSYSDIIENYVAKGYVRKVSENERYKSKWYLPHFPVLRPDKDTTKIRIVFDASAKCQGISLNDAINQGPKLQRDLFDVLMRFRRFPVAVVCDIAEMYLRIGISHEDQPYHRFLWRGIDQDRRPDVYEFDRVVFGMNSSPFLAQFVLQHHAKSYRTDFPLAAETIDKSTYMDDSMDSVGSSIHGIQLYQQLSALLSKAGMHARKWLSNSSEVLGNIPTEDRKAEVDLDRSQLPCAKTLGIWWRADTDVFTFRENVPEEDMAYTKRNFLKKIATLFDPIGFLAPYTVRAKMLLQDMWTAGIDWDDELTEPLTISARAWFAELLHLQKIQVSRCLWNDGTIAETRSLHTFVDASESAYGAVVYARCQNGDGTFSTNIVAAKTRVSPNIATSIPRLELMGAIVGVRLTTRISDVLGVKMDKVTFWCDSVNVLWWVRGRSRDFKPFVANRVGEIQTNTQPTQWRYVPTGINPADMLSRGMHASDLAKCNSWWRGPEFLLQPEATWPLNKTFDKPIGDNEMKRSSKQRPVSSIHEPLGDQENHHTFLASTECVAFTVEPTRYSSWLRLRRVQAWVSRFIENCRRKSANRTSGELMTDELKKAEIQLIKHTQYFEFLAEWKALALGQPLPTKSKLFALKPKLDNDGIMRSDGRLKNAKFLSFDVRHPVILPRRHWVTKLIVKEAHERGKHAFGTNQTLATLSARYWIISAREEIREWERECAECRRRKSRAAQQIMAPLPLARLQTSLKAFTRTSVDFGGPFITIQGRGKRREKRYLCLFTCLATRAVHLEMAFGLDTDSFLNAFFRMANRRGLPEELFSDNGTNFKGADRELTMLLSELDERKINTTVANKGVKWNFNPPLAPHFGGAHESMIKSAKKAITAILGQADITDEELMTAIIGAEGLINSRPLTYQSANHEDDLPLTPNHFLHGQIGGQFAPTSVDESQFNPRKRWRRIQELIRHFWRRWLREWLPGLNARKKWHRERRDIQVGEVVLVISPDTPRGNWPLGRVLEVYPGDDGRVRVVKVQVGQGTLVRSITKLCPLEGET